MRKFAKLLNVIFETISHFSRHNSSEFFLAQTFHTFYKSSPKNCKFSDFPLLALKFTKFLMSFLKRKVSFFSKFGFLFRILREFFSAFLAETLHAIDKSSTLKCKFSVLPLLALKFIKLLMSFLEPRVSFSSNFASLFSVMRHSSSVLLLLCFFWWAKEAHQMANFQPTASMKINQIPYVIF